MRRRWRVLLAVLSILVTTYQYVVIVIGHFRESTWDEDIVQQKSIVNNTWTKVSSFAQPRSMENGKLQGGEIAKMDRKKDVHKSFNKRQYQEKPNANATSGNNGRSTSKVIQAQSQSGITSSKTPACCLWPAIDVTTRLTPEFFEEQRTNGVDPKTNWTGTEYEEWVAISERLNPNHGHYANLDCTTQYTLLVLEQVSGFYLRCILTELGTNGRVENFPYYEETAGLHRILLLGDSISKEIRNQTQLSYHGLANIQGAPTNGLSFYRHQKGLKQWLGHCPWDLVQFNVGMHFHPPTPENYTSWYEAYRGGITFITNEIRNHSPKAHIVFSLTTPSPFDTNATTPNNATCANCNKFHKAGFVSAMNSEAKSLAKELGIIINDRYSFMLPVLEKYQKECDVHFTEEGSRLMSDHDWELISAFLSIKNPKKEN